MAKLSLDELVQLGAHFGHQSRRWNPKMAEYIYGEQDGVHIFNLEKTAEHFEESLEFLKKVRREGKTILFVGTKKQVKDKIAEVATSLQLPYVNERWLGGTLTNFEQIKKSLKKLKDMKVSRELGEFKVYTKKEQLLLDREIERLERFFGGMKDLTKMPEVLFIVDVKKEATACIEAKRMKVPTVGIVDTNCDPNSVDYMIPMNDDAVKALDYVLDLIKDALSVKPAEDVKPKTEDKTEKKAEAKKS